jgi:hypothetical protein
LVYNPSRWDRFANAVRSTVIGALQRRSERNRLRYAL